ncbi:MAG: MBL fold metallo-hydrolase, partial [Deltaproteobacteria bacterium]|nr:MBL fold metallo-hydrolase [Deltaproteobacteria bacterium]
MGVNRPDFGAAISVLDAIKLSLPQDRRHRSDRTAIGLLTAALREGSIQPSKIPAHLDRFDHALRNTTDQGQLETLRQAHAQLSALLHADAAPASSTAAARLAADDSILHPKQIKPDNLFIHGSGVVALMSGKAGDEKRPMLVLQSPQWAVRKLFGQDVKAFLGAGSSLNLQTGIHETEFEFPGYLLKFLLGRTANFILFNDEIGDATSIVNRSYLGRTWNLVQDTLAKSFPKGADVPDLDAEVRQLEAPFPAVGEGGLWGFTGIERGGEVQIENWRLRHLGNRKWRIHESHKYIGDIDLADYPIQQPTRPTFMEDVIKDRKLAKIRYEALFEGKPMIVPLGSGSGLTQEEASSHLSIDEAGNVTIVDPNVNVIEDLVKLGIPFGRVKRIIVTHVHFDHVAGIWRLLRYLTAKPDLIIHANPGDVKKIRDGEIKDGDEMSTLTALFDMAEKATHRIINGAELLKGVNVVPIKFDQPMSV